MVGDMEVIKKQLATDNNCRSGIYSPHSDVESEQMDSDEELPIKWLGEPQPISFPIIKEEYEDDKEIVKQSMDCDEEITDLCSPPSVITLDESDEEEFAENNRENTPVNKSSQQQYVTIDLTLDENEDNDEDVDVDIDSDGDDDSDRLKTGSCANVVAPSSKNAQSNWDKGAAAFDSTDVIKPSFICRSCKKCFISQCSLYQPHLGEEMNYLCTLCMTLHETENVFHEHLKLHENRFFTCQLCKDKLKPTKMVCPVCSCSFDSEELYKNHQKIHTDQKMEENNKLVCQACNRNFVSKTHLERHERLHTEKLFKCNTCGRQFWTQQILVEHQYVCGAPKTSSSFKCSLCQVSFDKRSVMVGHMMLCTDSQSRFYYCEICSNLFTCINGIVVHRLVHLSSKSANFLDCDCCDMKFFSASGLAAHKYCTGKITYSCSPCNMQFLLESSFLSHLRELHSVQTANLRNENLRPGSIRVEKISASDENVIKNNNLQSATAFQVKSHDNSTQNVLLPDSQEGKLNPSSSPSRMLKNMVSDTSCLQQDNLPLDQKPSLISKRVSEKVKCSDEISPTKKLCKISTQSTTIEKSIMTENNSSNISSTPHKPLDQKPSLISKRVSEKVKCSDAVSPTKKLCKISTQSTTIEKSSMTNNNSSNSNILSTPHKRLDQKPSLISKSVSEKVKYSDEISPTVKRCKISTQSTTTEKTSMTKNNSLNISSTPHNHLGSLESERNIFMVETKNSCTQTEPDVQEPQAVNVACSPPKQIDSTVFPMVSSKNTITNMQRSPRMVVRNTPRKKNVKFKLIPLNKPVSINSAQLLQALSTASLQPKQSGTINGSKIELDNTPTKIESNSEFLHVISYESSQLAQKTSPTFIISPTNGIANIQPSSQITSLSVGSPQSVQNVCVSSSQPKPLVLQPHNVPTSQIKRINSINHPVAVQNDVSDSQPNTLILQTINVAVPQPNQITGYISHVLPSRNSAKINYDHKAAQSDKIVQVKNVGCARKIKTSVPQSEPEVSIGRQASPQQLKGFASVGRKTLLPRNTSKICLLSAGNANTSQVVPVCAVQSLPVDKVNYLPVLNLCSVSDAIPTTPQKNSAPNVVLLPNKTDASQVVSVPVSQCQNSSLQPVFIQVLNAPGNTRLQRGLQEFTVPHSQTGQLRNKFEMNTRGQVGVEQKLVMRRTIRKLLS